MSLVLYILFAGDVKMTHLRRNNNLQLEFKYFFFNLKKWFWIVGFDNNLIIISKIINYEIQN